MSIFSDMNSRLMEGLSNAKAVIESKNGNVMVAKVNPTIEELITGIETIPQSSGGGGRNYYELMEEAYASAVTPETPAYRFVQLVSNAFDTFTIPATNGNSNMQWWTSDGGYYAGTGFGFIHTWDKSKDLDDGLGFGNRWIVGARSNENGYIHVMEDVVYCLLKSGSMNSNSCFKAKQGLIGIKDASGTRTWASNINGLNFAGFFGCNALREIMGIDLTGITTFGNGLQVTALTKVLDLKNIDSNLILNSNMFTKEALVVVLNALTTKTSATLTLGLSNLGKLTEADKAIAIGKGWTLA